jgi:hypothetical protein
MRVRTNLTVLLALTMVVVSGVAFAETFDKSVKGSEGALRWSPSGSICYKVCDTLKVRNSTNPPIVITVSTKNKDNVIHESKSINPGAIEKFHLAGPGITDKHCVTEAKGMSEVCEDDTIYCAPTLSQWVLIVLALSVAGFFIWQLRRRRKAVVS